MVVENAGKLAFVDWMKTRPAFSSWNKESSCVEAVLKLHSEGATVPFIARYRKKETGNLDEVEIQKILDEKERWDQIEHRKQFILSQIKGQNALTPELEAEIQGTFDLSVLDDLYLPFKKETKTKAAIAKEAGLEPLAQWMWDCTHGKITPEEGQTLEIWAFTFKNESKGITDAKAAIDGAIEILVEKIAAVGELRQRVRNRFFSEGFLKSQKTKSAKSKSRFEHYFNFRESIQSLLQPKNSHRYLAMKRGQKEKELSIRLSSPESVDLTEELIRDFERYAVSVENTEGQKELREAAQRAFRERVMPSIELEVHKALQESADRVAVDVFAKNLEKLLLAAPFGSNSVLGIDPGIKTGCKLAVVNPTGKYVAHTVIHLLNEAGKEKAKALLPEIIKTGDIKAIAIGNGTGSKEVEHFVKSTLREAKIETPVVIVSESGASIYSASETARKEFPDLDVTIRGAISIARRLQDPLAEYVKLDPKTIGVGQYQHDISQTTLKRWLSHVVESCVNRVGVDLNTASYHLLSYVSGIGPVTAESIVSFRETQGVFQTRNDLLKVPRLGKKTFEMAAGFLRVPNGTHPLDNTGVHPESFDLLEKACQEKSLKIEDALGKNASQLKDSSPLKEKLGEAGLKALLEELEKPGRDVRPEFEYFEFRHDINSIEDLKPGMICPGIVSNVTNFGAFVNIGVHQDGLVHISELSHDFVKDPKEFRKPGDKVQVRVLEVFQDKRQIALSLKQAQEAPKPSGAKRAARPSHELPKKPHVNGKNRRPGPGKPFTPRKPKQIFNNPFSGLAGLRENLKSQG